MNWILRQCLRGFLIGLLIGGGIAVSQQITKSLQMSQDNTGVFGIDTNLNLYVQNNRHLLATPNASAPPSVAGSGCVITANSTDFNGQVTGCTASAAVTFGQAYLTAPRCVASTSNATNVAVTVTSTLTTVTIAPNTVGAGTWNWFCSSVS